MKAAIYVRISRDREGAGLGVERQRADCEELAARHGWTVTNVFDDNDMSAYSGRVRRGYAKLLDSIQTGAVDVVLAWHTDRLHRSPVELEAYIAACEQRNIPTHTVKAGLIDLATPSGRLVARQLGAVARYEVEHQSERAKRQKAQAAADGKWRGGVRPFGYAADGVTLVPEEADIVAEMYAGILAGASIRGISIRLNQRGATTSTGHPWRQDAVRSVLLRARNAGLIEHNGTIIGHACWPAIVEEDTWRAVRSIISDPDRRTNWSLTRRWLLSNLAVCGVCEQTVIATTTRARVGPGVATYQCRDRHVGRIASELDRFIVSLVLARLQRPDAICLIEVDPGVDVGALHNRLMALRERLDDLTRLFTAGEVDARQLAHGSSALREQVEATEREIGEASRGSVLAGIADQPNVAEVWEGLELDRKRAVIGTLMSVVLKPAPKGRPKGWKPGQSYFNPDYIDIDWKQ